MLKPACVVLAAVLLSDAALGCDLGKPRHCERRFIALVEYRVAAIADEFGDLAPILPDTLQLGFSREASDAPNLALYDPVRNELDFSRRLLGAPVPRPLVAVATYWAMHHGRYYREEYPIVAEIDNAIWSAYLEAAAHRRGLTWPHEDCNSADLRRRLPCEMLTTAIADYVSRTHKRIFNTSRLGVIWPEDYQLLHRQAWRSDDRRLADVRLYGGLLLLQPLVQRFGVARTLAYAAQTPFTVDNNNVRASAVRYQENALLDLM